MAAFVLDHTQYKPTVLSLNQIFFVEKYFTTDERCLNAVNTFLAVSWF